jgi:hypothetical protein
MKINALKRSTLKRWAVATQLVNVAKVCVDRKEYLRDP